MTPASSGDPRETGRERARPADELIDYSLPADCIAQEPAPRREDARLLVLDRARDALLHRRIADLPECLRAGDLFVLNDSRVVPVRLRARRPGGGATEVLLIEPGGEGRTWTALLRPGRRAGRPGAVLALEGGTGAPGPAGGEEVRVLGRDEEGGTWRVEVRRAGRPLDTDEVLALCERIGETPLPPYIERAPGDRRGPSDRERYQTVYAEQPGSAAAPTAGLHLSEALLERLRAAGVETARVTLHVGLDTFRPIDAERLATGRLHGERVEVGRDAGERILAARREGRRIVCVGTTTVRTLESFALTSGELPWRARTTLFIRPGHVFRLTDALLTNFHLPRSTLLLLVAAFAGRERILRAYEAAVRHGYRFYSYGDAMLIV